MALISSSLVSSPRTSNRVINARLLLEFPASDGLGSGAGTALKSGIWLGVTLETGKASNIC